MGKGGGRGEEAIASLFPDPPLQAALLASLRSTEVDLRAVLAAAEQDQRHSELVRTATALHTPDLVAKVLADPRYRSESLKPPRKIGRRLLLFDCLNCDKCLPVCPNDANFVYEAEPATIRYRSYRVEGGQAVPAEGGSFEIRETHQIATFQDFCNDCGNCDTFCPEDGGPYLEKPRFFGSLAAWRRHAERDGFCLERHDGVDVIRGRFGGAEYRLEVDRNRDQATFSDGRVTLRLRHRERAPLAATASPDAQQGHVLEVGVYLKLAALLDAVLDPRRTNPLNA